VQGNDFVQTFRRNVLHAPEQYTAIMKREEIATWTKFSYPEGGDSTFLLEAALKLLPYTV
jgi:hypothetical protein